MRISQKKELALGEHRGGIFLGTESPSATWPDLASWPQQRQQSLTEADPAPGT